MGKSCAEPQCRRGPIPGAAAAAVGRAQPVWGRPPGTRELQATGPRTRASWRPSTLGGKFYALGTGSTMLFPEAEGTLRPGAFASVGLGVDNAR
jgi:hypothetical protein